MDYIIHAVVTHCRDHPSIHVGDELVVNSSFDIRSTILDDELNREIISEAIKVLKETRKCSVNLCYGGRIFVCLSLSVSDAMILGENPYPNRY